MSQIQPFQTVWERNQTQHYQKHKELYETQPNQKAIEWLETQTQREEIRQRAKNEESVIVINHLNNSDHDILTMVHQVLTKNEFSDDSSIFVVVPSVDNDAGYSSDLLNSNVCMQMSENPLTWKIRDNSVERDPKQRKNSSTNQGVKLFSKGKMIFMEGLPTDTLSYHSKEALFNRIYPKPKEDLKKAKKNKLCQIRTPNGIVERIRNRSNVVSVDTTIDRPCCCSIKTNQNSDYSRNNEHVAQVISNIFTPILSKEGIISKPIYTALGMNQRELIKAETLGLCKNPPCRPQRTGLQVTGPSHQLPYIPTQQNTRAAPQQHNRDPVQQLSCAPNHPLTWSSDPCTNEACLSQFRDDFHPNPHRTEAHPAQNKVEPCPTPLLIDPYPTQSLDERSRPIKQMIETTPACQCTPELLIKLFKIALKGGKWEGMPSFICGECPEPPTAEVLCKEPVEEGPGCMKPKATNPTCPCGAGSVQSKMQIEMGETKQKRSSSRQTRFNSTVGTSTDPKLTRKRGWWSWKKNICECPQESQGRKESQVPQPGSTPVTEIKAPEAKPLYDPEPYLTMQTYFQGKDVILSEELLKKNSLETERVSGFRLMKEKREPPEPEPAEADFTPEDAIRYLAMMNPDLFHTIMAEEQAKLDGTYVPPPPPPPPPPPVVQAPPPGSKEAFRGLKFKIGGKGSASQGLSGVCCFDLLTESFTTW
ncbi:hypothetical protein PYW08_000557 [Mythimna loreyi]|uniref:Uncharacterized protein n=1 Tax=Mythimna loreyi TaxID=667449 RepID=A0ACC2RCV7_9NEOP|nr:hypothetical protein PYW08_000557 [Mythimna loreyi]